MDGSSPQLDALRRAAIDFTNRSAEIGDRWDAPTICGDWTVTGLIDHIIGGSRMTVGLMAGASREEAIALLSVPIEGDLMAALRTALDEQSAAFDGVDLSTVTAHHPALDMSGGQLLGFRTVDLTLHAWDLARSLGLDEQLDDHAVSECWDFLQPLAPVIGQLGMFGSGPSGDIAEDAPLQTRLVDLTGRRV